MATAKDQGTDVVEALTLGRQRLRDQAPRFPGRPRPRREPALAQARDGGDQAPGQRAGEAEPLHQAHLRPLPLGGGRGPPPRHGRRAGPGRREARGHPAHVRPARVHVHGRPLHAGAGRAHAQQLPRHHGRPDRGPPGHHRRVHRRRDPRHLRRARAAPGRRRARLCLRDRHAGRDEGGQRLQRPRGTGRGRDGHRRQHGPGHRRQHRLADPREIRRGGITREPGRAHGRVHGGRAGARLRVHPGQGGRSAGGRAEA